MIIPQKWVKEVNYHLVGEKTTSLRSFKSIVTFSGSCTDYVFRLFVKVFLETSGYAIGLIDPGVVN